MLDVEILASLVSFRSYASGINFLKHKISEDKTDFCTIKDLERIYLNLYGRDCL